MNYQIIKDEALLRDFIGCQSWKPANASTCRCSRAPNISPIHPRTQICAHLTSLFHARIVDKRLWLPNLYLRKISVSRIQQQIRFVGNNG